MEGSVTHPMRPVSTAGHRTRLFHMVNDLDNTQLRSFLQTHRSNLPEVNFQYMTRAQLFQEVMLLLENSYTNEFEQILQNMRTQQLSIRYYQQQQPQSSSQARPVPSVDHSSQMYYSPQISTTYSFASPYAGYSSTPATATATVTVVPPAVPPTQHMRSSSASNLTTRSSEPPSSSLTISSSVSNLFGYSQAPQLSTYNSTGSSFQSPSTDRRQPNTMIASSLSTPSLFTYIVHKVLPFYRSISCVYQRVRAFQYDMRNEHHSCHDDFLLSMDACNQLALSYDYNVKLNSYQTRKCLLMRLARLDRPPMEDGKYDDNLPPNITIHINGNHVTNLPTPKASVRQHADLTRIGREVDITSYCMFNPMLKNTFTIDWFYRKENTVLHAQYAHAQYAVHIFLVERLTLHELCEQVRNKSTKFCREDLLKCLAKGRSQDDGIEISDQILKITCPIDQRRLKTPVRATTCQHLQCFDLYNYIALNEKSGRWICPVCNRAANFDDLQIDTYMESILNSINNNKITDISVDTNLRWKPIPPVVMQRDNVSPANPIQPTILSSNSHPVIIIDD